MEVTCSECGSRFTRRSSLLRHLRERHELEGQEIFTCPECGKAFTRRLTLKRHLSRKHSKCSSTSSQPTTKLQCAECGKSYSHQRRFVRHLMTAHAFGSQPPTSIPPPESSSSSLSQPSTSTSGQCPPPPPPASPPSPSQPSPSQPPNYQCIYCGKSYLWPESLTHHVRYIHTAIGSEICSFCGKTFTRKQDLSRHLMFTCPSIRSGSTMSVQPISSTDKLDQTETSRENALGEEGLEAANILMGMSRASTSTYMPSNTPQPCIKVVPRTPPDLPARVQCWMHEESSNQDMTTSSSSCSLADIYATLEDHASDSSSRSPTKD